MFGKLLNKPEEGKKDELFENQRLLDTNALAAFLGVTDRTVRNMLHRGDIPYYQVAGAIRFDLAKVLRSLERKPRHVDTQNKKR